MLKQAHKPKQCWGQREGTQEPTERGLSGWSGNDLSHKINDTVLDQNPKYKNKYRWVDSDINKWLDKQRGQTRQTSSAEEFQIINVDRLPSRRWSKHSCPLPSIASSLESLRWKYYLCDQFPIDGHFLFFCFINSASVNLCTYAPLNFYIHKVTILGRI